MHPTSEAHEAPRSSCRWIGHSTRELQAPESNRVTDRMKVSSAPTGLHHPEVAKRQFELLPDQRRASVPLATTFWASRVYSTTSRRVGRDGVEPPQSEDHWFTASLAHQCTPTLFFCLFSAPDENRTHPSSRPTLCVGARNWRAPIDERAALFLQFVSSSTGRREVRKHEAWLRFGHFAAVRVPCRRLTWSSSPLRSRTLHPRFEVTGPLPVGRPNSLHILERSTPS